MLPTYQRFNSSSSAKVRSFRASEKILIFLVFISFLVIVLFGFFLLPDFGTNGVIQVYNKFKKAGPEIFIPAPPIADKYGNDFDRIRLQEKIRNELDVDSIEKPELKKPERAPIVPIAVPEHNKKHHNRPHDEKTTQNTADSPYVADGTDQDPISRERRDKVKEVSGSRSLSVENKRVFLLIELEPRVDAMQNNLINGSLS